MNPVLQYVVRQMVEDSSAASPASGAPDKPLKALEEARQAINRLIEQSLPGIREQDQLWRAICLYADLLANFHFYEGVKAGAQLYDALHEPLRISRAER